MQKTCTMKTLKHTKNELKRYQEMKRPPVLIDYQD